MISTQVNDLHTEAINLFYTQNKPNEAIKKIDQILGMETEQKDYYYSFKADILRSLGQYEKVLKVVNEGLSYNAKNHTLRKVQKLF
jgi:tetratricopeptide (TPR) repeat protein